MVAVGIGWFAEDLKLSMTPWIFTIGLALGIASSGFLVHLVLAFPTGCLTSRTQRMLVGAGYVVVFVVTPFGALFADLGSFSTMYPPNQWLIANRPAVYAASSVTVSIVGSVIAVGTVVVLCRRWITARAPLRRLLAPVFVTGLVGGLASAATSVLAGSLLRQICLWVFDLAFCALPLGLLASVLRVRLGRSAVGDLLVQLRHPMPAAELQVVLAHALGDTSLRVGYWTDDRTMVDGRGQPLELPDDDTSRAVTVVERGGRRVAALVHDPASGEDRHVLAAVSSAAGLALENQWLAAQVAAQLAEVRASRTRILAATDAERRRVERDLHDGAQQRLVAVLVGLRVAEARLREASDSAHAALVAQSAEGLEAALRELRGLARGIHPAVLTEAGLAAAVEALVQRCPLAIDLSLAPVPRLAASVEMAAYFVVAEALTNVLRHAHAMHVEIVIRHGEDRLTVIVTDDGNGSARLRDGTGLLGLRDRVRALDGDLTVASTPGSGTIVAVALHVDPTDMLTGPTC